MSMTKTLMLTSVIAKHWCLRVRVPFALSDVVLHWILFAVGFISVFFHMSSECHSSIYFIYTYIRISTYVSVYICMLAKWFSSSQASNGVCSYCLYVYCWLTVDIYMFVLCGSMFIKWHVYVARRNLTAIICIYRYI